MYQISPLLGLSLISVHLNLMFYALRLSRSRLRSESECQSHSIAWQFIFGQFRGNCLVVGRKSPVSLNDHSLVSYDKGDVFDHSASPGFIHI